jgi:3-hydroxyisobutyrate dehydrogenase
MGEFRELVGIVGIGQMGLAMVKHLRRNDYDVVGYDVNGEQCQAAAEFGATIATAPAEVARRARFTIIAVGYDDEATQVILSDNGLLAGAAAGSIIAVSSTCTPKHVKLLAEKVREGGCILVDAPICRGGQAAEAGTMLGLVGATLEAFERTKPIYSAFCSDIALLGDVGAGQFGKAINNFFLWTNGMALIEAGRLGEAYGMDLVKLRDALMISSGGSDALKNWENVSFIWALKDMQIVSKISDESGLSLPMTGMIKELVKDGLRIKRSNPPDWTGRKSRS